MLIPMPQRQLLLFPPPRPLVERLGAEFFWTVPERPGVYLMCGAREGVLYVGKAKNLRRRLASYRSANPERLPRKLRRLLASVERILWDLCPDEAAAIQRERELLRALRPRFNSVGVYPAPAHHLGWQWRDDGLALGIGEATEGWRHRCGPFTRIKPVYSAILRLAWRAMHPAAAIHQMPLRLGAKKPPAVWNLPKRSAEAEVTLQGLTERLEPFLRGQPSDLPEWLLSFGSLDSKFEAQWCAQESKCLVEFQERFTRNVGQAPRLPLEFGQFTAMSRNPNCDLPAWRLDNSPPLSRVGSDGRGAESRRDG